MSTQRSLLYCEPLSASNWGAFEDLVGGNGACGGCWCMTWRSASRKEFEEQKGDGNRKALKDLARKGPSPGVLLFLRGDDRPLGWCSVGPRSAFPGLARSRVLKPVDEKPVWSVTCFFIRKDMRRQGLTVELLKGAAKLARDHGARWLEGYPILPYKDPMPPVFAWTGMHAHFKSAGFQEVARHSKARPIMRLEL